jgi:hypothetical protein
VTVVASVIVEASVIVLTEVTVSVTVEAGAEEQVVEPQPLAVKPISTHFS